MLLKLCVFSLIVYFCSATSADPTKSYDILYNEAIEAYLDENWDQCVARMNEAIEDFHFYKDAVVGCRIECMRARSEKDLISPQLEDMKLWERMIKQTLCILKCKKRILRDRAEIVDKTVMESFDILKPYDYLQLCYFKVNDLIRAASSAYTFLTMNPEHEVMKGNLRYYINDLKVDPSYVLNLEAKPYVDFYIRGMESYGKQDYDRTTTYMELSLIEYLQSEEECRALCEGPFDQGWFPDFISSISNHYTFTLRCKQKCAAKLGNLNGEIHKDLLPSHYHYLQFAYYKMDKAEKACQAVASYQLFFPEDETMKENKEFYQTLDGVTLDMFQPRAEALQYFERDRGEKALLRFIEENFQFDEGDINGAVNEEPKTAQSTVNEEPKTAQPPVTEPVADNEILDP